MDTEANLKAQIETLTNQLQALRQERAAYLQERPVFTLLFTENIKTHAPELLSTLKSYGISFISNQFTVLSFRGPAESRKPDPSSAPQLWTQLVSPVYIGLRNIFLSVINVQYVGLTCQDKGTIYVVVNLAPGTAEPVAAIGALCQEINRITEEENGFRFFVSVSEVGNSLYHLRDLRRQTDMLSGYQATMEAFAPEIVFYNKAAYNAKQQPGYESPAYKKFSEFLSHGEFQKAKELFLDTIMHVLIDLPPSPDSILHLHSWTEQLSQAFYECCQLLGLQDVYQQAGIADTLSKCRHIQEVSDRVVSFLDLLEARWTQANSISHLANTARAFIDKNYANCSLNVSSVSSAMGVSSAHLSRAFKLCFNCGTLEYIKKVRIAAAKRLLGGKLTMQQIAEQTGFGSSLNMNRAFKQLEKTTPTEYFVR